MEKKEWSVGVFAAVFNPAKELLLLKRTDGKGWNLVGGRVDFGDDAGLISALTREVKEETGLFYSPNYAQVDFVGVYPSTKLKDMAILFLLTYSEYAMGKVPELTEEALEYRFVDREILKKEIQLVSQQYPGHEFGRMWQMTQDAFGFVERYYERVMERETCNDCGGYDHDHLECPVLRRKDN